MNRGITAILITAASLGACEPEADRFRVVGELASDRIEISAETSEPIIEIAVSEGQAVAPGQVLVRQDSRRAAARVAEAEAVLAQQQARLDELVRGPRGEQIAASRASLAGAEQELDYRQAELRRIRDVHNKGLAAADALDRASVALDAARANRDRELALLEERLAGTTDEELAQAEQAVKQASARRDAAELDLERLTLTAPAAGIADSRLFEVGERPPPGQPVIVLLSGRQPYARVYVPEEIRVQVSAGREALIHVDGLSDPLPGRVRWVSSEAAFTPYYSLTERDRSHLSYVAKVDISGDRERLPDGIPVEVELRESGRD